MRKTKAIIVGGGIGGLAAARAFDKIGLDYVLLERASQIREVGSGIVIGSNGINCLKTLGVEGKFKAKAVSVNKFQYQDHKGNILSEIDISDFKEQFGAPMSVIHRADLINVLLQAVNPEKIFLNSEVQSFSRDSEGVTVHLVSGKNIRGDILIGADGLHSVIRKNLSGYRAPRYAGYTCWRGIVAMPHTILSQGVGISGMGLGAQFGLLPFRKNEIYWYVAKKEEPDTSKELKLKSLKTVFSGGSGSIQEVIHQTSSHCIMRNDIFDLTPGKFWGEARCTLLGDAAHTSTPNLGQGASMALEDSVELAYSLLNSSNEEMALRAFEKRRYKRTADMVRMSRLVGEVYQWSHPILTKFRNVGISLTPWISKRVLKKCASFKVPAL